MNTAKKYYKISGLTLIEVMITITVIVILTAASMANMSTLRKPKDLVDEATDLISNILNQANAESLQSSDTIEVCYITRNVGDAQGTCNESDTNWKNINGNKFDKKVTVTVIPNGTSGKIQYQNGLVIPDSSGIAFEITIKDTGNRKDAFCLNNKSPLNTIKLWSNGVLEIARKCTT